MTSNDEALAVESILSGSTWCKYGKHWTDQERTENQDKSQYEKVTMCQECLIRELRAIGLFQPCGPDQ